MQSVIEVPESKESELATRGTAIIAESRQYMTVRDDAHRDEALSVGQRVRRMRELVAELFDDPIAQAHKLHKSLCGKRKLLDDPLEDAAKAIARGVGTYETNKRAQIEAQRQAELAEQRRKQAEAEAAERARAEAARKAAEDARLAEAARLEAQGKHAQAAATLDAPIYVAPPPRPLPTPPPTMTPKYEKPPDTTVRLNWKFRIVDPAIVPREFLMVDEQAVGAVVRAQRDKCVIPGIEVYCEAGASIR